VKTIFDIPAHPLFVHGPIVLLPLVAIVTIVAGVRPGVARKLGYWLPLASLGVFVMVLLAMQSGEELYDVVVEEKGNALDAHVDLANTTRLLAFGMLLSTVALWWFTRRAAKMAGATSAGSPTRRDPVLLGITVLVVVLSALSTVWMVRTGHEGARIHWKGVIPEGE
jgi:hypothetical protein